MILGNLGHLKQYFQVYSLLGFVYAIPDSFPCRREKLSGRVWTAKAQNNNKSFIQNKHQLHRSTSYRSGWSRAFDALNFRLKGFQSSLILIHFRYGPTVPNLSDMWRFNFEISATQLHSVREYRRSHCSYVWTRRSPFRYERSDSVDIKSAGLLLHVRALTTSPQNWLAKAAQTLREFRCSSDTSS